ncbi:inositol-trisphosphate 3-kinase homolog [Centruroides sculpturatus]|uniref:inositol-trisphosphate 3-kinase homolog n=1 Tax=Centruroides sculpturatus TaxID=218467 RepID=UPI000C6CF3B3|nr:inositol-trisphosphate 3-kinase homolog [Centruroides sculpturatus]
MGSGLSREEKDRREEKMTNTNVAKSNGNKNSELAEVVQQKNLQNLKKAPKKKWKRLTRSGIRTQPKKLETELAECQLAYAKGVLENIDNDDLTLLHLLALSALELTAPASDILLKNQVNNWVQLSGHEGSLAPAGPGTIWKKRPPDNSEVKAYEAFAKDVIHDMVPRYYKDVEYNGEHFIEMEDLLFNFKNPSIMDIKMGTRTFLESEVQNSKARNDLYEKMVKIDTDAPTSEERKISAITKLRYMQFRENLSSSSNFGFRIEGFKAEGKEPIKDLKQVRERHEVIATLKLFLGNSDSITSQLIERLKLLRKKFEKSEFFSRHEVIGSSLLIVHDGMKVGAWMIDFAKTVSLPDGVTIDHRSPWVLGNHEDGYLFGLDNLISVLEDCLDSQTET